MVTKMNNYTKKITRCGLVGALYVLLSLLTMSFASGAVQFRISEGLCILPLIFPETTISVFVGCLLSNLLTGCGLIDIIFGSLVTLLAGVLTFIAGKIIKNTATKIAIGGIFPVALNAFLLPLIWIWCYGIIEYMYMIQMLMLLASQTLSVYLVGVPLYLSVEKFKQKNLPFFK